MWLDRLKYMKKQSGKTSKEISDETGIPKSTIDKLFSGQTKEPYLSSIKLIVHCLGYSLDDLDDTKIIPTRFTDNTSDKQQLLHNYDKLNDEGKERLLVYSKDLVCSGNYLKVVTVVQAARTPDNRASVETTQMTEEELSIFDQIPQSDDDL